MFQRSLMVWCMFLLCTAIHAEVIELEGKVKSIDKDARTISVVRKTAKGEKTLELEVAKKAGDLSEVEEGDSVAFSYDPDLELITKIAEDTSSDDSDKASAAVRKTKGCRFRLEISDTGEAKVVLEPVDIENTPGKTERTPLGEGVWRCTSFFNNSKDLAFFDSPLGAPLHATVNTANHSVMLTPKKKDGLENPVANIVYPIRLRVPLSIEIDVTTTAKEDWPFLQVYAIPRTPNGERPVFSLRTTTALRKDLQFDAWSSKVSVKQGEHLVKEQAIDPGKRWEKSFRLPLPNVKSEDFYGITIGALGTPSDKTYIHRIEATAFFSPVLGLALEQQGDVVFVKQVNPKTLASKSMAKEGDVIVSINNVKPTTVTNAVELIGKTGFGDSCEIVVKRGDQEKTIHLNPTWDD